MQAATGLAGEQAGRILPELLRPRDWHKVPREERQRVRALSHIGYLAAVLSPGLCCRPFASRRWMLDEPCGPCLSSASAVPQL